MFIVTARVPKKKLLAGGAAALVCCLAVCALALAAGRRTVSASAEVKHVRDNGGRVAYLNSLGWQVSEQPIATEELLLPERFDDSYADYLKLQSDQGFDLAKYAGKRVKRYTYQLTNYPGVDEPVRVALLIYKGKVVGGQIQSASGGLLRGLTPPPQEARESPAPSQAQTSLTI